MARPALILLLLTAVLAPCAAEEQTAEDAKTALAEAKEAHKRAVEHAQDALRTLEDCVKKTLSPEGARLTAAAIEQGAAQVNEGGLQKAQDNFQGRLSDVAAAKGDALKGLAEQADRAAEAVAEVKQRQAREARSIWAQMQKDRKQEAKSLYEKAKTAAKEVAETTKSVEHAARRAGVAEPDLERAADAASSMEDRAKDLNDEADSSIESFFGEVEGYVSHLSDAVADEAFRNHEQMHKSIRAAVHEARKREAEQAQRAKQEAAATKGQDVAEAPQEKDTKADDGTSPIDSVAPAPVLLLADLPLDVHFKDGNSAGKESRQEPSKERPEQKAEAAKEALAGAQEAHAKAIARADDALRELEDVMMKIKSQKNAQSVAEAIQKDAVQIMASELEEAQKNFKDCLSKLASAEGEAVNTDIDMARHAADKVAHATRRQAGQIRSIWAQMQKAKKMEVRHLGDKAKRAARDVGKTAKSLEHAQRYAGVKESVFERDADRNMEMSSKMKDRAEDLRDTAEDSVERFFGKVEGYMERHSDAMVDEAYRHRDEMHESIRVAEREASMKQAEQARHSKQQEAAPKQAAAPAREKKDSSADDGSPAPAPAAFLALAAPGSAADTALAVGVAGLLLIAVSMGFGLLAALFPRRRAPRDAPLLLG